MHILVVHAMVILLTMGPPKGNPVHCTVFTVSVRTRLTRSLFFSGESDFYALLDIWFPDKKPLPTAFLVDTSEEALLLPDWLKLRMIRSEVSRLVDAGNLLHEGDARSDLSFFFPYLNIVTLSFSQRCRTSSLSSCCSLFSPSASQCPA